MKTKIYLHINNITHHYFTARAVLFMMQALTLMWEQAQMFVQQL